MKILQTNFFTYPHQSYQIVPYKKQENNLDVFVKNTKALSFSGNAENENPYQEVLQNPQLVQKVMELITSAATILVGKAAGIIPRTQNDDINVDDVCNKVLNEQNQQYEQSQEVETFKQEIEGLKKENEYLKQILSRLNTSVDSDNLPAEETIESEIVESNPAELADSEPNTVSPKEQSEYVFVFPKKKVGILSKSQKELKAISANLSLDQNLGEKFTEICKELLQSGSHPIDGKMVDNKEIINDLVTKLYSSNFEDISQVIDEFYEKCELDNLNKSEKTTEDLLELEPLSEENISQSEVEIYETKKVILPGLTVKGKIDLNSIKERKKVKPIINEDESVKEQKNIHSIEEKRPRISKPEKDFETASQFDIKNEKTKASIFTIPGTVDKNVMFDIKRLLLHFEKQIEKENINPRYQCNQPLSFKVQKNEILKELDDYKYKHINKNNIIEVIDALNSDPRFHKMFTLHAAMRLIDRFADFNSDELLDEQCHKILDKLTEILQKSFKEGLEVRRYEDDNGNIGLRLFISEDIYDDDAKAIFGVYPFRLGICENQPDPTYYNKYNKNPLICTIFTNGI